MKNETVFLLCLSVFIIVFAAHFAYPQGETREEEIKRLLGEAYIADGQHEEAAAYYEEALKEEPKDIEKRIKLAEILSWEQRYAESIEEYKKVLELEPDNFTARLQLAEVYSWNKQYKEAVLLYRRLLDEKSDPGIKKKLADTLSWNKQYDEALALYDEVLEEKDDKASRVQKARVLGWDRKYADAISEYDSVLKSDKSGSVKYEKEAKEAYWNNRVKKAIKNYKKLIELDPGNIEAMFDLAQIFSYESMWEDAAIQYRNILTVSPNHFRAKEGLEKADLIGKRLLSQSIYEYLEGESDSRDTDILRHSIKEDLSYPLNPRTDIGLGYSHVWRSFDDFKDIDENHVRLNLAYANAPDWRIKGFYGFIEYDSEADDMHLYGADFTVRTFDIGNITLLYEHQRLENSSLVIIENYDRDIGSARFFVDLNKKLKAAIDYTYGEYSDGNSFNEPGFDILYYFSLEPRRFSVNYRYFYRGFEDEADEYFSPADFWTQSITLDWRHFLNKEEIFFGADDLYYDLAYKVSVDSEDVVSHRFSAELNWDINKRSNMNIKGSITDSSNNIYQEKNVIVSFRFYF